MQTCNGLDSPDKVRSKEYVEFCKRHDHVVSYLLRILEDCFNNNALYGHSAYLRDRETLERRFCHEGLSFATKTLPSLFDSLLDYLENGVSAYPSFRIQRGQLYPVFLQQLFAPIYDDCTSDAAVLCIGQLYQLCVAFKKLKGPYKNSVLTKQLSEFVETDQNPPNWSDMDETILLKARSIIRQVLDGLNPFDPEQSERFIPRPGPGATNTPIDRHMRYRPHVSYAELEQKFPVSEWFTSRPTYYRGMKVDYSMGALTRSEIDMMDAVVNTKQLPTSRFKFVHKTFGKPRGICIEEYEVQWLQQALRRALYDRIENHPLTKGYVSFTDQSINGRLALQASCPDSPIRWATLDMSEGSDRIFRTLVEYLFQDNKELLTALLSLSTRIIELPKDIPFKRRYVWAQKFAPMGSALCFPVMGLVHFALIKAISSSVIATSHINDIPVYVYGDDIIVDPICVPAIYESLPRYGMKINVRKSYYKSLFRESCGVHAYNGKVITPTRFKTVVYRNSSANDIISALRNESDLYYKRYRRTAEFIREELHTVDGLRAKNFPVVGPKSNIVGYIRDYSTALHKRSFLNFPRRWSSPSIDFRYRVRIFSVVSEKAPPVSDDEYYLRSLVEKSENARQMDESSGRFLKICYKWVPDSAFL